MVAEKTAKHNLSALMYVLTNKHPVTCGYAYNTVLNIFLSNFRSFSFLTFLFRLVFLWLQLKNSRKTNGNNFRFNQAFSILCSILQGVAIYIMLTFTCLR